MMPSSLHCKSATSTSYSISLGATQSSATTLSYHLTDATRFLLAAGIDTPRECLVCIAGFRELVFERKLLLPYYIDATYVLDHVMFLLDLFALPNRRLATARQLITPKLLNQGR
ncbi:hypothetical protein SDRG_01064 [Saprolegnia diclina VS20]|uniref:Uncharacterized protein n=1 Tax=Saprolegnia diclina (strain VS20) TaxID=1156394 RepID=T0SGY9_SAPDV|nr:hypothetical protein SDRG_01064 [Saprolegnia diclina VS20]EQC42227.1 hypothetical protein SDRG_01064 [Saprolegnia diclina VS20]|eukprot:XP_008604796.1 hypothetical protein SDRG_01064 [Saprolegnia diclina VS20]